MYPRGQSHDWKNEEGWGRLWEPWRVASHPMLIIAKLEGYFGWNLQCLAPPKQGERGL